MPTAAVTDNFHHHVTCESLPVFEGEASGKDHCFGIFAMDMKNGSHDYFCGVRSIAGGACIDRQSSENDLVVGDDMKCASGPVPAELGEIEGFGYHSLAGKSGIAVNQHRQDFFCSAVAKTVLPRTALPLDRKSVV